MYSGFYWKRSKSVGGMAPFVKQGVVVFYRSFVILTLLRDSFFYALVVSVS